MKKDLTRREFIKGSAAAASLTALGLPKKNYAWTAGSDKLKIALVGCGGRGTGAARDCLTSSEGVEIIALGDLFKERLDSCRANLQDLGDKVKIIDNKCFTGFNAFEYVLMSGPDIVLCATPPGFRPFHVRAAIEAGKHVFMEKPIATCPTGVRHVMETAKMADSKGLGMLAGTQYRHHGGYQEIMNRIHKGEIGKLTICNAYYMMGQLWNVPRKPGMSDIEWQIKNWLYFTWLSADQPAEQFIHNLDIMNWVNESHPAKVNALGGRQVRTDPAFGGVYDHFAIEYEYPSGAKVHGQCRQMDNCFNKVCNYFIGTEGSAYTEGFNDPVGWIKKGDKIDYVGGKFSPYVQEHGDFIKSLRDGKPLNEGQQVAESTLTCIMGRMAAYTGQEITWEQALNSKLDLMRDIRSFGPMECDAVAMPGRTPLI